MSFEQIVHSIYMNRHPAARGANQAGEHDKN